jgi:hypothetical protein
MVLMPMRAGGAATPADHRRGLWQALDLPAEGSAGLVEQSHIERAGGVETAATAFVPGAKPIWLTEIGVPAVDKGGNAPNVFPIRNRLESGYPHFSSGARDDLVQARALEAIISGFDPARAGFEASRNPVHPGTGIRMVDPANIFVWSWDARPFPAFPDLNAVWADGSNYETGHWINGRIEGTPVDRLVRKILADFGLPPADEILIDGFVDGYVLDRPLSARQALEPLGAGFGFDATMSAGKLRFHGRGGKVARQLGRTISCSIVTAAPIHCAAPRKASCRSNCASVSATARAIIAAPRRARVGWPERRAARSPSRPRS